MGDDHSRCDRLVHHAVLPLRRLLPPARGRLHRAGRIPGRDLWAESKLSIGTIPDRGAGDRVGLLLPPRGDLGGFTGPLLALFAATQPLGFAVPMLVSTVGAALVFVVTLLFGPETKGKVLVSHLSLAA